MAKPVQYWDNKTQSTQDGYVIDGNLYTDEAGTQGASAGSQYNDGVTGQRYVMPDGTTADGETYRSSASQHVGNNILADLIAPSDTPSYSGGGMPSVAGYGGGKPSYNSGYDDELSALLDQILNGEDFSYNYETDPLYHQYKESYTREGERSMQDTLGQVSARTGGLASSYAGSVGQQAYNYYMQQLNDKIPELEQRAYGRYRDDQTDLYNKMGLVQNLDNTAYGRHRDNVSDFYYDQNRSDKLSQQALENQRWDMQWQSQQSQQALENGWYERSYSDSRSDYADSRSDYADSQAQQALENGRYEDETAFNRAYALIQMGFSTEEIASALGIPPEQVQAYANRVNNPVRSSGGGRSGGGSSNNETTGIVDKMLSLGDDTAAYEYLVGLGYTNSITQNLWAMYQDKMDSMSSVPWRQSAAHDYDKAWTEITQKIMAGVSAESIGAYLDNAVASGLITASEAEKIADKLGF